MMNLAGAYWLFPSFNGIYGEDCSDLAEDERKLSLFLTLRSLFFFFIWRFSFFSLPDFRQKRLYRDRVSNVNG